MRASGENRGKPGKTGENRGKQPAAALTVFRRKNIQRRERLWADGQRYATSIISKGDLV